MRSRHRPGDQRLDSSETRSHGRQFHIVDEAPCFSDSAFEFETQNAAKTFEQVASARMVQMSLKAGVIDAFHCRMTCEESRDLHRAFILIIDAYGQRLHSTVEQE